MHTRRLTSFIASLLLAALAAGASFAQNSIGWNYSHSGFGDEDLLPDETAGAPGFEQANWNNHASAGQAPGVTPLTGLAADDAGTAVATTVDVVGWSQSASNSWHYNGHGASPDDRLTGGFANQDPTITFGGVNSFTPDGYTVVVYYGNNEFASNPSSTLTVNGQVQGIQTADSLANIGGFVLNSDEGATDSNYAVFSGVNGDTLTVSLDSSQNDGISAVQIVEQLPTDPPATPSTPSPANLATAVAIDSVLDWADAARADEYDVVLWPSTDPEPLVPVATVTASAYDPPADLAESTSYSWRIIARNSASGMETGGPAWTFVTGANVPPAAAANPSPADGATSVSTATGLDWDDAALAASYNVYLWIPPAAKPAAPTAVTNTSTYVPPAELAIGTAYRWTVEAVNGSGVTPAADEFWSFATLGLPAGPPSNPSPSDTASAVSPLTGLDWDDVGEATSYHVRLWPSAAARPEQPTATVTGSSYQPVASLETSTAYTWEVEATNAVGTTNGGPWTFTTGGGIPGPRKIGWNNQGVGGVGLDAAAVAGAPGFAQSSWNNHPSNGQAPGDPIADLLDDTGATTSTDVVSWTQTAANSWQHNQTNTPDETLMNDFANQQAAIAFGEIPYPTYDVVVYYGNNEGPSTSTLTVGDKSREITTGNTAGASIRAVGYLEGTDDNTASPSNYSQFTGLDGASLSVSLTGENNNGICAIQIIQSDSGPPFQITAFAFTPGGPAITFNSVSGAVYKVERSTDLTRWFELEDGLVSAGDSTSSTDGLLADDLPGATRVYYRVTRIE